MLVGPSTPLLNCARHWRALGHMATVQLRLLLAIYAWHGSAESAPGLEGREFSFLLVHSKVRIDSAKADRLLAVRH